VRSRARVRAAFLLSLLSVWAPGRSSRADAGPRPRVTLALDPCLLADPAEVRRAVGVELGAELAGSGEPETTRVSVSCTGSIVLIEVIDPVTGKSLSRTVNLDLAAPAARARLFALAIVELVTASWTELQTNPEPQVPPASGRASPEVRAAALQAVHDRVGDAQPPLPAPVVVFAPAPARAPASAQSYASPPSASPNRVEGLLEARGFLSSGIASFGIAVRWSYRVVSLWGWSIDVLADHGRVSTSLGPVSVDSLSGGPSVFAERGWRWLAVQGSAGLRVGAVRLAGSSTPQLATGSSLYSPWGGPFLGAGVHAWPTQGFALELGGEAGEAPFAVRGFVGNGPPVTLVGVWLAAHAGGVFSF